MRLACAGLALLAPAGLRAAAPVAVRGASPAALFVAILAALAVGYGLGWFAQQFLHRRAAAAEAAKVGPLEGLIAGSNTPSLLFGANGQWLAANAPARQFFSERSMTAEEATPKKFVENVQACAAHQAGDFSLDAKIGTLWINWTLDLLPEGHVRARLTDVTAVKTREIALTRERDAALATARSTSDFIATLSHDIRVPMNGVLGMANLLLEAGLTPQQRELARSVVDSAENVITLADELLDLAKIEAGKLEINPQPTEIATVLEELLRSQAGRAAEKHLDLAGDLDAGLPAVVHLDPLRLRQILANFLSNAIKFTERGEVVLRAWVEVRPTPPGTAELRFSVRDTGIGIPPEKRDRLFQAFSQADSTTYGQYGGTGLGLVTCQRVSGLMGGRVWYESETNQGSIFYLALPYQPVEGAGPMAWTHPQPQLQNKEVLVVEDNARLTALYADWIGRWGARAIVCRSANEAKSWLDSGGRVAAALIDLDLPDGSATTLLRTLAQLPAPPRLVATTARPPESDAPVGNAEILLKPLSPDALIEALRRTPRPVAAAAPPAAKPAPPAAPAAAAPAQPKARVIVADDDVVNQKVMRTFLERLGCDVRTAVNGVDALALLSAGPCDILFLDIMMPRMDGLQTVRELRRLEAERKNSGLPTHHLPVVAITAKVMPGDRESGLAAGFDDYATKPISDGRLREALQRYVANFQPPGPIQAGVTMLATPQIALIDRERLKELGSDDAETMREIVKLFFERMDALLPDIESTLAAGDLVEARRHAHTGAGSCATCGIMQGQNVMRRLERSIEAGQFEHSRELLNETRRVLAAARKALVDVLPLGS